jgi:hypothetical protein
MRVAFLSNIIKDYENNQLTAPRQKIHLQYCLFLTANRFDKNYHLKGNVVKEV